MKGLKQKKQNGSTKKQEEEIKKAMRNSTPAVYGKFLFKLQECPGYEGYIPKELGHEV